MKIQKLKPDTDENPITQKQLWTTIPNKAQETISGGISLGYKNIYLKQNDQESNLLLAQEFAGELATLRGRVD